MVIEIWSCEQLWRGVINPKYGEHWGAWSTAVVWRPHSCSLWKGIQVGWIDFLLLRLLGWGMEKGLGFGMMSGAEICL